MCVVGKGGELSRILVNFNNTSSNWNMQMMIGRREIIMLSHIQILFEQ